MNLLAVTVTLSIQTCIVRLYNVKKKFTTQYVLSNKSKRSIFFHYYVVLRPKK